MHDPIDTKAQTVYQTEVDCNYLHLTHMKVVCSYVYLNKNEAVAMTCI